MEIVKLEEGLSLADVFWVTRTYAPIVGNKHRVWIVYELYPCMSPSSIGIRFPNSTRLADRSQVLYIHM